MAYNNGGAPLLYTSIYAAIKAIASNNGGLISEYALCRHMRHAIINAAAYNITARFVVYNDGARCLWQVLETAPIGDAAPRYMIAYERTLDGAQYSTLSIE